MAVSHLSDFLGCLDGRLDCAIGCLDWLASRDEEWGRMHRVLMHEEAHCFQAEPGAPRYDDQPYLKCGVVQFCVCSPVAPNTYTFHILVVRQLQA